ncbi:hypothetical protein B0H17DRAFT_1136198 [Mycena rosella]|uniref:Uncharacterized protein n=1 Tax=Mycena rosella TaxID=1033263 RepID=A0AAD7GES9_MYCRO|nr:hypothetical protein B0H17DRAFT_1136198 [Mycena rosella]
MCLSVEGKKGGWEKALAKIRFLKLMGLLNQQHSIGKDSLRKQEREKVFTLLVPPNRMGTSQRCICHCHKLSLLPSILCLNIWMKFEGGDLAKEDQSQQGIEPGQTLSIHK